MVTTSRAIAAAHGEFSYAADGKVVCSGCGEGILNDPQVGLSGGIATHVADVALRVAQEKGGGVPAHSLRKAYWAGHHHGYEEGREYALYRNGCGPDPWDCDCRSPYDKEKDRTDEDTSE